MRTGLRDQRRRAPVGAQTFISRRCADRLYRRVPERPQDQGQPYGDEIRMLAAEAVFNALTGEAEQAEAASYEAAIKKSWIWEELRRVRNIRPSFKWGMWGGLIYSRPSTRICCAGGHPGR